MIKIPKIGKNLIAIAMCMVILMGICMPVHAESAESGTVLKVAFYPLDGFFEYDNQGKETGYGVDILNKISQYTGIKFEYVKADSWEVTKQMLLDGDADIRMPGTMPVKPSATLGYTSIDILDTYEVMLTLKDRDDLYYQDYDTIHTLKIAITDTFYSSEDVDSYLSDIGVTKDQLVFCDGYNECYEKLKAGEVDALITNIMDMTDDCKMIVRFRSISNYISMTINNPYLRVLGDAITQIKLDEPMFFSNLYELWFPERTMIPLSKEEWEYLSTKDTLTFAFSDDEGYLSHYKDGNYYGIYVEQAKLICEKLGKNFKAVSIQDCINKTQTADIYAGFFYDNNYANEKSVTLSSPISSTSYYIIQKKEKNYNLNNCRIAAIKLYKYTEDYLEKQYKDSQFIYYTSFEECLKAVENGDADVTVINNYIAEYYLGMYKFADLSSQLSQDYSHMFCFATESNNKILSDILTKTLTMISDKEMTETYIIGQEDKPESEFLQSVMYKNPVATVLCIVVLVVIIIVVIMLLIFMRKSRKQNAILQQALHTKSTFLARMSHDMRTPLNVIIGMKDIARDNKNCEDTNCCLDKIGVASEFLLGLINDTLDLEKVNNGKTQLHLSPYAESQFREYIDSVIEPLCAQKNIRFEYHKSDCDDIVVMQDKLRINQIYFNLLSNAVKFTPEGGTITYTTDFKKKDNGKVDMTITISDTGIGMSEEYQRHMFEPFSQENQQITAVGEGTGLGLAIVKKMCDLMNITITVHSEVGRGTTFILNGEFESGTLECNNDANDAQSKNSNIYNKLKGKIVLVCEDHPLNQEIIFRILEKRGMIVEIEDNGKNGVENFKNSAPGTYAAILMDIRMPVMDGIEATKEIRALDRSDAKRIPIIALTANAYDEDVKSCIEAGMNGHLAKPVNSEKIYKTLLKLIEEKQIHE